MQSIGVAIAGAIIWWNPKFQIVDPLCTIFFAAIVMYTTLHMAVANVNVLLEGVPREVDIESLKSKLSSVQNVVNLHDLHVWELTPGAPYLTAHIRAKGDIDDVLRKLHAICTKNGIVHATIQVQSDNEPCFSKTCCH